MKDTKTTTPKLNPEIKKKAEELFTVIEQEVERSSEDELAETMAEEIGGFLKTAKGFDMLQYGYEIAQTESERAIYCLEEAAYRMKDDAVFNLCKLYENVLSLSKLLNTPVNERSDHHGWHLKLNLDQAEEKAKEVKKEIGGLWEYRSMNYRDEIEELKKVS